MEKKFRYRQFLYVSKAVSLPPNNERKSQTKSTLCPFFSPPLPLFCHPFAQLLNFFTYSPNKYCTNTRQYPLKTLPYPSLSPPFPHAASHRTHLTFCDCDACMYLKVTHFCHNLVLVNHKWQRKSNGLRLGLDRWKGKKMCLYFFYRFCVLFIRFVSMNFNNFFF